MKQISVNGNAVTTGAETLGALLAELQLPAQGIAVAVESRLVKRTDWDSCPLAEGTRVTIVKAVCGG